MNGSSARVLAAVLPAVLALAACSAKAPQPAPEMYVRTGEQAAQMPADEGRPDSARHGYTAADVRFVQHMISHHAQALAMTSLVTAHTTRPDMRLLAERIDISQKSEISTMQHWLRERREAVPNVATDDIHHDMARRDMSMPGMAMPDASMPGMAVSGTLMPGMLTLEQMDALARASGPEFDRLFLQGMIQHHEGALVMVADLFATQGSGQESELFRFASDVDADQRAEIMRMRAMQAAPNAGAPNR